jgi:hypothetical protein
MIIKYAIRDYEEEIYYKDKRYEWTKKLGDARFFDDERSAAKTLSYAESDAIGVNAYNRKNGKNKVSPSKPKQLVVLEVGFTPEKVGTIKKPLRRI